MIAHLQKMKADGKIYQYEAQSECFPDVINAFHLLLSGSNLGKYKVIMPTIKTYWDGECAIIFWSTTPIAELKKVWSEADDLHLHWLADTLQLM